MVANPIARGTIQELGGISKVVAVDYSVSDVTLAVVPRAIHVNAAGTAIVRFEDDSTDSTIVLNAGQMYPYRIKIVRNSGTTASMGIKALY